MSAMCCNQSVFKINKDRRTEIFWLETSVYEWSFGLYVRCLICSDVGHQFGNEELLGPFGLFYALAPIFSEDTIACTQCCFEVQTPMWLIWQLQQQDKPRLLTVWTSSGRIYKRRFTIIATVVVYTNNASRCFIEQETVHSLLSTGWFQERTRVLFHFRTKVKTNNNSLFIVVSIQKTSPH